MSHFLSQFLDLFLQLSDVHFLLFSGLLCGLSVLQFLKVSFVLLVAWLLWLSVVGFLDRKRSSVESLLSDLNVSLDASHSFPWGLVSDTKFVLSHDFKIG